MDDSVLLEAAALVGFNPVGRRFAIAAEHRDELLRGTLSTIPGGFAELASFEIPRALAQGGAKAFGFVMRSR